MAAPNNLVFRSFLFQSTITHLKSDCVIFSKGITYNINTKISSFPTIRVFCMFLPLSPPAENNIVPFKIGVS